MQVTTASRHFYKPFVTSTAFLAFLLLITVALIVLSEIACRQIPQHAGIGVLGDAATKILSKSRNGTALQLRQNDAISLGDSSIESFIATRTDIPKIEFIERTTSDTPTQTPGTTSNSGLGLGDGQIVTPPSSTAASTFTTINSGLNIGNGDTQTPAPTTSIQSIITEATTSNTGLSVGAGGSETPPPPATTSNPSLSFGIDGSVTPVSSQSTPPVTETTTDGGLSLGTGGIETPPPPTTSTSTQSAILEATTSNPGLSFVNDVAVTPSPTPSSQSARPGTTSNPGLSFGDENVGTSLPPISTESTVASATTNSGFSLGNGPSTFFSTSHSGLSLGDGHTGTVSTPTITSVGTLPITSPLTSTPRSSPTVTSSIQLNPVVTSVYPTSTFVNSTGTYLAWSNGGIGPYPHITLQQYIYVAFVPLVLAVVFSIPWHALNNTIREMEPFYQLNRRNGALGRDSLCLNYGSSFLITIPFMATYRGHFTPLWSSLISLSTLTLAPLSSEAFFVSLGTGCYTNTMETCHAFWGVYPLLVRLIQAILAFVALLLILLILLSVRRTPGVFSEPLSIVGLGVLLSKSPLMKWLKSVDSMISSKDLSHALERKKFKLSWFTARDGTLRYGIIPLDDGSEEGFAPFGKRPRYSAVSTSDSDLSDHMSRKMSYMRRDIPRTSTWWLILKEKTLPTAAFLICGGLLAMISYYHWTGADATGKSSGFETFMDSRGFGVRFMMAVIGVAIKLLWSRIDTDIRKSAPCAHLLKGAASPRDSILLPAFQDPISAIIPSLRRRHYLTALVSFIAIPAEFLPLFLANIPFSFGTTKLAYTVCNYFSMAILSLMCLTLSVLVCRKLDRVGTLPRKPDTIASVGVYLANTDDGGMLDNFAGLSTVGRKERDRIVGNLGGTYSLGFVGDGNAMEEVRIDDDMNVRRLWAG